MNTVRNAPVTRGSHVERSAVADIRVCFSYAHTDAPFDGSNTFTRALRKNVSCAQGFTVVNNLDSEYDVLFMNQLSRSPGSLYALSEIREALDGGCEKKLVVRAVNLECNDPYADPLHFLSHHKSEGAVLDLLNMADFVIFQSAYQKDFFDRFGYDGKSHTIIHNGAVPAFLSMFGGTKRLEAKDDLVLISSAMSTNRTKRQEIIAALSFLPGVRVIHSGVWPQGLDQGRVELTGVLSHEEMVRLYERGHFLLHPAIHDVCPNSLIEGLGAGLPAIYNPGPGSGSELCGKFGISLDENDLPGTVARAREEYEQLATALVANRHYYSIDRAASDYISVFKNAMHR
jgi:glycosyltransferase involved in cell wall biosynthesis